jgi:hypothetical protein
VTPGTDSIALSWTPVPAAASYVVLRNEFACDYSYVPIGSLAGTAYGDTDLAAGPTYFYRVQAVGLNGACSGPVSGCISGNLGCQDIDGDGFGSPGASACSGGSRSDCDDTDGTVWTAPGAATDLRFTPDGQALLWSAPMEPGGTGGVLFDTIRSDRASDFMTGGTCVETDDGSDLQAIDPEAPGVGECFFYLVRGGNGCGESWLGMRSGGQARSARSCP